VGKRSFSLVVGEALFGLGRLVKPLVPVRIAKAVDDRFFGAVFQVTRGTNDNYDSGTKETPANLDENR
jgi:hypothetical protein